MSCPQDIGSPTKGYLMRDISSKQGTFNWEGEGGFTKEILCLLFNYFLKYNVLLNTPPPFNTPPPLVRFFEKRRGEGLSDRKFFVKVFLSKKISGASSRTKRWRCYLDGGRLSTVKPSYIINIKMHSTWSNVLFSKKLNKKI